MSIPLGPFQIFSKNTRRYSWMNGYHGHRGLILVTDFPWSPVSLIPAINLSPATTTPAINLLPVITTLVISVCEVSMDVSFHGGSNETISGRVRLWWPEISPFWFEVVLAASGASNQGVWGVYGCVFSWWFQWHHRWPEILRVPGPLRSPLGPFHFFWKIPWDFREWMFITGVNDTGNKREKILFMHFFHILLRAYLSPLYTLVDWIYLTVSTVLSPLSLTLAKNLY